MLKAAQVPAGFAEVAGRARHSGW